MTSNCIDTISSSPSASTSWGVWIRQGWALFARDALVLVNLLQDWQDRARQRRELGQLDERLLKDVGLCRTDALVECNKPFWRD